MIARIFTMRRFLPIALLLGVTVRSMTQPLFSTNDLDVQWEVIENSHQGKTQFLSAFTVTNLGQAPVPATGWALYFNFARAIKPETVTAPAKIEHLNGDLYRLTLNGVKPLNKGDKIVIWFVSSDWVVNFTDAPAGLYVVFDGQKENGIPLRNYQIKPSTEPKQYLRFPGDKVGLITPADIYHQNDSIRVIGEHELKKVFPTPLSYQLMEGSFSISGATVISTDPAFVNEADLFAAEIRKITGKSIAIKPQSINIKADVIIFRKIPARAEGYTIKVTGDFIEIGASSAAGIFYGIQSILTLIDPISFKGGQSKIIVPAVEIVDEPRFSHRAFFLDVSRNFQSKEQLFKMLDLMGLYKLNVLHLHLNDDEGWRLEIPGLPELTSVGSRRIHAVDESKSLPPSFGSGPDGDKTSGSGFYSRQDYLEILRYATRRHIVVIPEIEMPGHARAAVKSMDNRYRELLKKGDAKEAEKYLLHHPEDASKFRSVQGWNDNIMDPALPSTYVFLEKVIDEVIGMYAEAEAPLTRIHCGGDEVPAGVWEKSPAVLDLMKKDSTIKTTDDLWYFFYGKVNRMLQKKKLSLYGWEEVAMRKTKLDGKNLYIPNPDFAGQSVQVDVWNNVLGWGAEDLAYQLANAGYKVVLSCVSHLYFDMAYYKSFDEPGYYWGGFTDVDKPFSFIPYDYFRNSREDKFGAPLDRSVFNGKERLTDYGKQNIVGIQGLLWAENITSPQRLEYMVLPKLLPLAERAWAAEPLWSTESGEKYREHFLMDYSSFLNVVGKRELRRLDFFHGGFLYRIPTPGIKVVNNLVRANIQFPGLEIRYTTDGTEPNSKSKLYTQPLQAKGTIRFRTFNSKGRGSKVAEIKAGEEYRILNNE
jgi:hexosaminidase